MKTRSFLLLVALLFAGQLVVSSPAGAQVVIRTGYHAPWRVHYAPRNCAPALGGGVRRAAAPARGGGARAVLRAPPLLRVASGLLWPSGVSWPLPVGLRFV